MNSGTHALVSAASAQVGHGFVDVGIGRLWFSGQERRRRHEHAALAVAALRDLLFNPGLLQGAGFVGGAQGFDGVDVGSCNTGHGGNAGANGLAVFVHCASTASCDAAAEFGAGKVEGVSKNPEQGHLGIDV